MTLRLLQSLAVLLMLGSGVAQAAEDPSALVKTETMQQSPLSATINAYGVVNADTRQMVNINFPRGGQVARLMVTAGQTVKRGTPLVEFRTDPAEALAYQLAETLAALAREDLTRTEALAKQRLATQSQLAAARKALADAKGSLEVLGKQGKGTGSEQVKAPFDGFVTSLTVNQGDRVAVGATLMQLAQIASLRVDLGVEPEDIHLVSVDFPVRIVSVFDRSRTAAGKVLAVNGVINPQTRLVDVLVEITGDKVDHFIPGMQVLGEVILGTRTSWVVPRSAVLHDDQGAFMFQVDQGHAKRIAVSTAEETDQLVAVSGPFDPKLKVVVEGNYELQDGMVVREDGK